VSLTFASPLAGEGTIDKTRLIWPELARLYESIAPYSYALIRFGGRSHFLSRGRKTVPWSCTRRRQWLFVDGISDRFKRCLPVDSIEIIHTRFPCRSPEMHFFGYRFRGWSKGKGTLGDICWILMPLPCGLHDRVQIRFQRFPSQERLTELRIGDQRGRVAGP